MPEVVQCPSCRTVLPPSARSCPSCSTLVHAAELQELSRQAAQFESLGDRSSALAAWRQALDLLPPDCAQAASIRDHILNLSAQERMGTAAPKPTHPWIKKLGPAGVVLTFLLKFKTAILIFFTKFKFLIFGLTKLKTLLSMLVFLGVYWSLFGWRFAAGFVAGIYIHEMGHVWALRRFGIRAGAPMFIPGFGALVSLYQSPADVGEDARIGLAGPIWGAAAALGFATIYLIDPNPLFLAIAHATAWLNLFNLIPIWQLDGGRGFRALARSQRLAILGLLVALGLATKQGMFLFLILGALYRIFWEKDHPEHPDAPMLFQFASLVVVLGAMLALLPAVNGV